MAGHVGFYRRLVRLYPQAFRDDYADDLVQNFADLIADHGPSRTWKRTAVDLAVTVPRYRLETVMSPRHTNTTLYIATAIVVTAAAGGGVPGDTGAADPEDCALGLDSTAR